MRCALAIGTEGTDMVMRWVWAFVEAIVCSLLVVLAVVGLIWLASLWHASRASAEDIDGRWTRQTIRGSCVNCRRYAQQRYYAAPRYEDRDRDRRHCHDVRRAVGDQHLTLEGAKKAANDAWAGTIRFHLGEKFMDLSNAQNITYTCSRSSIKEGGVTTLGQTLTRCEVEAQPCRAARATIEAEEERRP